MDPSSFGNNEEAQRRNLARSLAHVRGRSALRAEIQDDLGVLGRVLLGLVLALVEKGVITHAELLEHLRGLDGDADGKVTPDAIRAALGLPAAPPRPAPARRRKRS
jgi:hypothetical protein